MPMRRQNVAAALKYLQDKADLRGRFERATSLDPQEQDMADIAVETAAGFIPGVGQALAARDVERARRADDPAGMAMASIGAIPGGRLAGLLKRYDPVMQQLDVYHGTPHKFPATEANPLGEFDASKIGTGEGAQAYGHGIYYAENPEVAKGYQPRDPKAEAKLMNLYKQAEARQNYDAMEVLEAAMLHRTASELREQYPNQKALVNRIGKINEKAAGALYKADLPDEMIDRMLDWDKPLSEQPAAVREHVMRYMNVKEGGLPADMSVINTGGGKYVVVQEKPPLPGATFGIPRTITKGPRADSPEAAIKAYWNNLKGEDFYKTLSGDIGEGAAASEHLRSLGIPGVRYLDAGSRGQGGSGTRNFVVFPGEEKKVRILERK
jgi:hypothetical protein